MVPSPKPADAIQITAHAPERRKRPVSVTAACACCCCCCCCLHTIGGLIGGITGSLLRIQHRPKPVDPSFPFPFRRDEIEQDEGSFPVAIVYWLVVLFGAGAVAVYYFFTSGNSATGSLDPNDLWIGGLIDLLALPAIQLVASPITLVFALFYSDRRAALVRVGKITLWSTVGSLAGIAVMFGMCGGAGMIGNWFN